MSWPTRRMRERAAEEARTDMLRARGSVDAAGNPVEPDWVDAAELTDRYEFVASWLRPEIRWAIEAAAGIGDHGKPTGADRHRRRGEKPCPACVAARRRHLLPARGVVSPNDLR